MIHFQTSANSQEDGIIAALKKLYSGKPVGAAAIGKEVGMLHRRVLDYLHQAKDAGKVTPVYSSDGGVIRGWVPGHVVVTQTIAETNAHKAAAAVRTLSGNGEHVSTRTLAKHLGTPWKTVARWLKVAQGMQLVKPKHGCGWIAISNS